MAENHLHTAPKFQAVVRAIPDHPCTIQGDRRYTYKEVDERSNALANTLLANGIERGDRVAVMERNSSEYIESYLAAMKLACVPLNVNYKYQPEELRHIINDSGASALVIHEDFLDVLKPIRKDCKNLRQVIVIGKAGKGDTSYEDALKASKADPDLPWTPPNNDDVLFLLYTGGTTGFPKGVMWGPEIYDNLHLLLAPMIRSLLPKLSSAPPELFAPRSGKKSLLLSFLQSGLFRWLISRPRVQKRLGDRIEQMMQERYAGPLEKAAERAKGLRKLPNHTLIACPLMHGTGFLSAINVLASGDCMIFLEGKQFDPAELWRTVERESVRSIIIVGDAFAMPLLDELERGDYDTSSLVLFNSSGVAFSPRTKQALLQHIPQAILLDSYGASEGLGRSEPVLSSDGEVPPMKFRLAEHMKVFDDNDEEVQPGDSAVGQLAVAGLIPRGYWGDEEKTRKTFRTIRGRRYAMIGDMAQVNDDGSIKLLGRGSGCINTGGEKVYPEEVESVIKDVPEVFDCAVVGVDDKRWGQAITGIVAPHEGEKIDIERVLAHCAEKLANYKKPKELFVVDEVPRKDNGKLVYPRIRELVEEQRQKSA